MCGIIGATGSQDVSQFLIDGLKRLEYRGYDSAGIAVITPNHDLARLRTAGRVEELQKNYDQHPIHGHTGIAHTRWATHGEPNEKNAHPHIAGNHIAIVHNGIIENHLELRDQLAQAGCQFSSETDSELIAHLVYLKLQKGIDFLTAVKALRHELNGAYAIGIICVSEPNRIIGIRHGSPLVIGKGDTANYIASDVLALAPLTQQFIYLEDGDIADITDTTITIYSHANEMIERELKHIDVKHQLADKGDFAHFMLKEIYEQPEAATATLQSRISCDQVLIEAFGVNAPAIFKQVQRVQIVACGTSYHAGLIGKQWIEEMANLPAQAEIASEFRYRKKIIEPNTLFVTLSQSGETADTLAALRLAKKSGYSKTLTICNVPESSLVRESDLVLTMNAGTEIGVASTKSFTCQLIGMLLLSLALGKTHQLSKKMEEHYVNHLQQIPALLRQVLALDDVIKELAPTLKDTHHALFLARGIEYPVAMEGALKLKEISYLHAEAYPAGELKHGPLALVDEQMPVILLAPKNELLDKVKSNLEEVLSRHGKLIVFTDTKTQLQKKEGIKCVLMPEIPDEIAPVLYAVPLQLLAYHVAALKGTDIDKPRNLAKSVTVE